MPRKGNRRPEPVQPSIHEESAMNPRDFFKEKSCTEVTRSLSKGMS